jgi:hypothetical protein
MKTWICPLLLVALCAASSYAQTPKQSPKYPAQLTIKVVTDEGVPVENVVVGASTFDHWVPGEGFGKDVNVTTTARTDKDGLAVIEAQSLDGRFGIGITEQSGFYRDRGIWDYRLKEVKDGKWHPWNPVIEVVFKPILNPIPMFAKKVGEMPTPLELPDTHKPVGFDLMKGDWVAPYGKGIDADLVFTLVEKVPFTEADKPFASTLIISFSNPLDGIQSVLAPLNEGSALRLPRSAPEAGYMPKLEKQFGRPSEDKPIESGIREDQNYFVRVRTVVDEKGKIKSAFYGKILGDISCDVINSKTGYIQFTYCLNPTSLDRNMEFDPKRNLFPNLPSSQRVLEP